MSVETLDTLLDNLIDGQLDTAQYAAVEAQLQSGAEGRRLVQVHYQLQTAFQHAPVDVASGVMRRLPDSPPGLYADIAGVVLRAWGERDLRERLRAAPREALAGAGISLPRSTRVVIVTPGDATLPAAGWIALPLPPADSPPIAPAEARARLAATDFGWLWGVSEQAAATRAPTVAPVGRSPLPAHSGVFARLNRLWSEPLPHPLRLPLGHFVMAIAGVALTFVGMLMMAGQATTEARLSGAAAPAGAGSGWPVLLVGLGALGALLFLVARGKR